MNTDWVVGIVISDDDDSVIRLWNNLFSRPYTYFDKYLERFGKIFALLYVV